MFSHIKKAILTYFFKSSGIKKSKLKEIAFIGIARVSLSVISSRKIASYVTITSGKKVHAARFIT